MYLAYCELFHPELHGFTSDSSSNIEGFFITILTVKHPYFFSKKVREYIEFHVENQMQKIQTVQPHSLVRNFIDIQKISLQAQIVEKIILSGGESICILKTFWLKCIQRKWKKICDYNKRAAIERKKLKYIKKNELTRIVPKHMGLVGMWYKSIS